MKRHNDRPIKEVLQQWSTQNTRRKNNLQRVKIRELWKSRMGTTINSATTEISVSRGKLYLTITSASIRQEMLFQREKIKAFINEAIGENQIQEVIVR